MAIELNFHKTDDSPWGFRLTGGADCDIPLTVIKVVPGSEADVNGLQVGDVVVRINDTPTVDCTHADANTLILQDEHHLVFAVRRDFYTNEDEEDENNNEVSTILENTIKTYSPNFTPSEKNHEQSSKSSSVTEHLIAEAISGEAEVLPGQNVLGVNFNKVDLSQSTILQVMKDQHKEEQLELKERKWSAFLQKPDRPIMKPKSKEIDKAKAAPYKVVIKKQKRKNDSHTTSEIHDTNIVNEEVDQDDYYTPHGNEMIEIDSGDNLNDLVNEKEVSEDEEKLIEKEEEQNDELFEANEDIPNEDTDNNNVVDDDEEVNDKIDTEEPPPPLDEQLIQLQIQLAALAQLPSSVQDSLESVTQQLSRILNTTFLHSEKNQQSDSAHSSREGSVEALTEEEFLSSEEENAHPDISQQEKYGDGEDSIDISERESNLNDEDNTQAEIISNECECDYELEKEFNEEELERLKFEEEKALQQERNMNPAEEFHQRRLEQRPTNPLAPVQRPIILPGGRRWSQPDDALPARKKKSSMSDEKITKTLDMYSETIVGHTKGINFLKYQPVPRNLDYLQKSEVYKLIHDMDSPPRGIASRPEIVSSEQDYYAHRD